MPRDIPVANDNLLVAFDAEYQIRELTYPYVGMQNHALGHPFRFGVWADNTFSWVHDQWQKDLAYVTDTLVTDVRLRSPQLELELRCHDFVDFAVNAYFRQTVVKNQAEQPREVRLFYTHDVHLGGTEIGNTAYYDPLGKALVHYRGNRYMLANVLTQAGEGIYQFATGYKKLPGREGTWRDAEDGELSGNAVAQGSVDSVLAARVTVPAKDEAHVNYWLAFAESYSDVARLNRFIQEATPTTLLKRTRDYWRYWVSKEGVDTDYLPEDLRVLFRRSLLVMRTHVDGRGGILAAEDSDIMQYNRDHYSYVWPRDGALVALALDEAGYLEAARKFYRFCLRTITPWGWFYHKYLPDESPGSSWHPWLGDQGVQLPIQEDETALVVYALWKHFDRYRDLEFVKPFYDRLVKNAADWMSNYVDPATGLPQESYDLWEERRGVFTWTTATVIAGLRAAARVTTAFGEDDRAQRYEGVASAMQAALERYLYDNEQNRFLKGVRLQPEGPPVPDASLDSSAAGVFLFGVLPATDPRVVATMEAIRTKLWVGDGVGGIARYDGDRYQLDESIDPPPVGNPWFICTLWLAD